MYSVVHIGGTTVKIGTEAGSNDITETAYPAHENPIIGMFGFL